MICAKCKRPLAHGSRILCQTADCPPMSVPLPYVPPGVTVDHVYPPIPLRQFDWAAYRDPEGHVGEGPTRAAAVADLLEQERD